MSALCHATGGLDCYGSKQQDAALDLRGFDDGFLLYKMKHGRLPTTEEGLGVLYTEGYLKGEPKLDPWGRPYRYCCPGLRHPDSYDLASYGEDGVPGGEDDDADITN